MAFADLTGRRFGRLVALRRAENDFSSPSWKSPSPIKLGSETTFFQCVFTARLQTELDELTARSQALTDKIELARELPATILAQASIPVEGLTDHGLVARLLPVDNRLLGLALGGLNGFGGVDPVSPPWERRSSGWRPTPQKTTVSRCVQSAPRSAKMQQRQSRKQKPKKAWNTSRLPSKWAST